MRNAFQLWHATVPSVRFLELIPNITSSVTHRSASGAQPDCVLLSQSLMDACQGIEPATHRRRLIRGDVNKCVNFQTPLGKRVKDTGHRRLVASVRRSTGVTQGCVGCVCVFVHVQHTSLLLMGHLGMRVSACTRVFVPKYLRACAFQSECAYLLQHHSLLLLEQGLELLGGKNLLLEDLLHLLWRDHLGTHHGHWHWNLDGEGWERKGWNEKTESEGWAESGVDKQERVGEKIGKEEEGKQSKFMSEMDGGTSKEWESWRNRLLETCVRPTGIDLLGVW